MSSSLVYSFDKPAIYFSDTLFSPELIAYCQHAYANLVIMTDEMVGALYAQPLRDYLLSAANNVHVLTVPVGEMSKSRATKALLEDQMFALGCGRDTCIIALGGGVITDLAGFIAATYCRGVPVIYFPTSLLAMVDAALGGKTGINTSFGKNLLGTFTQPKAVFITLSVLTTLPEEEYINAFAEVLKHGLIADRHYFEYVLSHITAIKQRELDCLQVIIQRSCEIKMKIVSEDQLEQGKRTLLNYGHTIAHALETCSTYQLKHGYAVFIGLVVEAYLAYIMNLLPYTDLNIIQEAVKQFIPKFNLPTIITSEKLLQAMTLDKKARQRIPRLVLLQAIGEPYITQKQQYTVAIEPGKLRQAVDYLLEQAC
ncbi:MAG: 3-dehydroquinate synthase [Gammaproteobacteria bacterium]